MEKENKTYKFFIRLSKIFFTLFYRVTFVNEKSIPESGAAILCSNHISILDMFLTGHRIKRIVHYVAKIELFKNPLIGYLFRKLEAFPVKRGQPDVKSIKTSLKLLKEGHIIGIFPEGTRITRKNRGTINAKPGVAMLALKAGVPLVPVLIKGNYRPFSSMKVIYGAPFYIDADNGRKYTKDELTVLSTNIMDKIYNLEEENCGGQGC